MAMTRSDVHRLLDAVPDDVLDAAQRALSLPADVGAQTGRRFGAARRTGDVGPLALGSGRQTLGPCQARA